VSYTAAQWFAELRDHTIKVLFSMPYRCGFGQYIALVGNKEPLGCWDPEKCVKMEWREGDIWVGEVELNAELTSDPLEYKYMVRNPDGTVIEWKPGENIVLQLPKEPLAEVVVGDAWDGRTQSVELINSALTAEPPDIPATQDPGPAQEESLTPPVELAFATEEPDNAALEISPDFQECILAADSDADLTDCISLMRGQSTPEQQAAQERQEKYAEVTDMLKNMYDSHLATYVVETVTDQALADLDYALTRSHELTELCGGDPAAPEVLAADRMVAAAAKRAVDMARALDATKSAGMLSNSSRPNSMGEPSF